MFYFKRALFYLRENWSTIFCRVKKKKKKKNRNFGRIRRVIVRAGVGVNFREPPDEIGRVGISVSADTDIKKRKENSIKCIKEAFIMIARSPLLSHKRYVTSPFHPRFEDTST